MMPTYDQNGNLLNVAKPDGTAVIDGNTQQVYADIPEISVPVPKATIDLSDWFKPPKLYYTLAALAVGYYLHNQRKR